jgi:hypothetical protein
MLPSTLVKTLLAASAVAGIAVLAAPSPGEAASSTACAAYARDVASDHAPPGYRGPITGLIALPFDITGALLTGRTRTDFRWKRAYDVAYADCMSGRRVAVVVDEPDTAALAVVRPRTGSAAWIEYCSAKYRSFDPETGTYTTYSGEVVPCR